MIDVATLTGAVKIALGLQTAGLMGNDDALIKALSAAAKSANESIWHLPILPWNRKAIKGTVGDITNAAKGVRGGGASNAGAFLENFVRPGVKWAHFDISGAGKC
jgi:leucyl aminopeptidase